MAVKYLDNAGTQYLVNKIKAIDGKIPTESQITTMITTALNTYKEGIVTIVESLPQTGEEGKLYLVVDPSDSDVYIVYTWEENAFKRMGSKTFTLTVDSALSSTSTNPVQNKVIKSALDGKANSSHTHGSITNDGKLATASRVVITGTDKKIGISTVTTTELGYLSGVSSAIQTQLNSKSATGHTHTAGDVAGLATVATSGSYNDLSNKPTINDSTITIQKNGSTVDSFTTNGSNKTINIPVPTKTSDLTNDSGFLTSTDISSKANDSEVLHKAQTETVTGEKTFKKDIKIIDLNANERPGVKFEVNGSFRTFEDAKDALPDTDSGDFGVGTVWSAFWLDDNTKIQNSMSDYVINDITFGTTNYGSVIELNNYYKVKYEEADNIQTDLRGMLRFELVPYAGVQKDSMIWTEPKLYFYAKLENDEFGDTILGHEYARWSKAYIDEINCYEIKFGGNSIHDILEHIVSLSYVTHYSSTALTSNSTNSLSIIDNQDSVKVNDKVIDSSGKMFYITSVDLRNNEFEVGSVVDTFAKDSAVVHTNEINSLGIGIIGSVKEVGGVNFNTLTTQGLYGANASGSTNNPEASPCVVQVIRRQNSVIQIANVSSSAYKSRYIRYCGDITAQSPVWQPWIKFATDDDVVHKSGNETVNGIKSFTSVINMIPNGIGTHGCVIKVPFSRGDTENTEGSVLTSTNHATFRVIDKDSNIISETCTENYVDGKVAQILNVRNTDDNGNQVQSSISHLLDKNAEQDWLYPTRNNKVMLGTSTYKWKSVYATNYYYGASNTEFSDKFVTSDTAQTVGGKKAFSEYITSNGSRTSDEYSTNARTNLWLMSNKDTEEVSGILFDSYRQNTAQGTGIHILGIGIKENSVRYEGCRFGWYWDNNLNGYYLDFKPTTQGTYQALKHNLGTSTDKWSTINGLNPGCLSLPDLNNGIDISSYLDVSQSSINTYTPPSDGYISIFGRGSVTNGIVIKTGSLIANMGQSFLDFNNTDRVSFCLCPVFKNQTVTIWLKSVSSLDSAKFFPCQGNV